jgi:Domain of unknown function (DUF4383)
VTNYTSPTAPRSMTRTSTHRTAAQVAALVVGIAFLLVGIAGFIPGITQNFDQMEFAGHESGAELLGVFQVSVLHNLVHLAFGVVGLIAASRHGWSRTYLIGGGLVYLALFVYGLIVDMQSDSNFVPLNDADNWLHLGLGVGMIILGLALRDRYDDGDVRATTADRI